MRRGLGVYFCFPGARRGVWTKRSWNLAWPNGPLPEWARSSQGIFAERSWKLLVHSGLAGSSGRRGLGTYLGPLGPGVWWKRSRNLRREVLDFTFAYVGLATCLSPLSPNMGCARSGQRIWAERSWNPLSLTSGSHGDCTQRSWNLAWPTGPMQGCSRRGQWICAERSWSLVLFS